MVAQEFTIQSRSASAPQKLQRTPQGWRIFELVFIAAMSSDLRSFVHDCTFKGKLKAENDEEKDATDTVWNGLIQRLEYESDLITLIVDKCDAGNGIQALSVLRSKFSGNTPAKSLSVLHELFSANLSGADTLSGAQHLVALNKELADDEKLSDKMLSAFLLYKLPDSFKSLRDSAIASGSFPSPPTLIEGIEQLQLFTSATKSLDVNVSERYGKNPFCYNCGVQGHNVRECKAVRLDCDVCGPKAGHKPEYCLAKNTKDIPASFSAAHRATILRLRAEYAKKLSASAVETNVTEVNLENENKPTYAEVVIEGGNFLATQMI